MPLTQNTVNLMVLIPVAIGVVYFDVRYRRIPNLLVIAALVAGLSIHASFNGLHGVVASASGLLMAFVPMLLLHVFGAMGAGDVKLCGAIGAILGPKLILPTLVLVVMIGALLAVYSMVRSGRVFTTLHGVLRILVGLLPGWEMPRFAMPADKRHTIPYGVAIALGSLISTFVFRA